MSKKFWAQFHRGQGTAQSRRDGVDLGNSSSPRATLRGPGHHVSGSQTNKHPPRSHARMHVTHVDATLHETLRVFSTRGTSGPPVPPTTAQHPESPAGPHAASSPPKSLRLQVSGGKRAPGISTARPHHEAGGVLTALQDVMLAWGGKEQLMK